jgi:chitodextrinase
MTTTSFAAQKFLIMYVGGSGGTRTGVEYSGQKPTLPFDAKYHVRFKMDGTYFNTSTWNGTAWTAGTTYSVAANSWRSGDFLKLRIPRSELGLTSARSLQLAMSLLYEVPTAPATGAMWAAVPSDAFGGSDGFNKNFVSFYEFDLTAETTASAAQVYNYELKNSVVSTNGASFTFKAPTGATNVTLQQSVNDGLTWTAATIATPLSAVSTQAIVTGLTPNTNYKFRLYVVGGTFNGSSTVVSIKTKVDDKQLPTVPANLTVSELTLTGFTLSWTASTDNIGIKGYEIMQNGVKIADVKTSPYKVTGLNAALTYNYIIFAIDEADNKSGPSNVLTVVPTPSTQSVTVYYKKGFSNPHLYYQPAGGAWVATPGVVMPASEVSGFNKLSVELGTVASIRAAFSDGTFNIAAYDSNNQAYYSFNKGVFTYYPGLNGAPGTIVPGVPDVTVPTTPANLKEESQTETSIVISWKASTDNVAIQNYDVFRNAVKVATVSVPSYTDNAAVKNVEYSYTVLARDSSGNVSPVSTELKVKIAEKPITPVTPPPPSNPLLAKVSKETDAAKNSVTRAEVNGTQLLTEVSQKDNVSLELSGEKNHARFEIPATSVRNVTTKNDAAVLSFKSDIGTMELPVEAVAIDSLAKSANNLIGNLKLNVSIQRPDNSTAAKLQETLLAENATLVGSAVQFRVFAESTSGKQTDVKDFGTSYVTRAIPLTGGGVSPAELSLVSFDAGTSELRFVPAIVVTRNGVQTAIVRSPKNAVIAAVQAEKSFSDSENHWAQKEIEQLASKWVVKGSADGQFKPNATVTRAEFASMLVRALGLPETTEATTEFTDVNRENWFAGAVGAASNAGLVTGFKDGSFKPNAQISRAEMSVMIERALTQAGKPVTLQQAKQSQLIAGFSDRATIANWAQSSIAKAVEVGIIKGKPNNAFAPAAKATRAEAVVILKRLLVHSEFMNEV